jgi:NAD(P)-dependent dehydrogenase (short-subunit alcohol dehydrogenase family)
MHPTAPTALVTGAARGIGREIARLLAARGVRVALHCRQDRAAADAVRTSLSGTGHAVFAADLSQREAAGALFEEVLHACGHVDILVNNAGIYEEHPVSDQETNFALWSLVWERTLAANLQAPADLCFLAARAMQARGTGGRIVNISSRGAFRGEPRAPAYGASKAGLNALGQSLAKALAPERILVFTVAPGWVATDMTTSFLDGARGPEITRDIPLGRVAEAAEVARAATWLALDAPESMTGCIIDLNGASYLRT